ncbi:hypothetical protein [Carboxylicivirga taeanensis]|uniref:hypothetical protein n=1 Tax=Carboxylicivirga taeanensis TaxID=1416875 RepID=UPI003F6DDD09
MNRYLLLLLSTTLCSLSANLLAQQHLPAWESTFSENRIGCIELGDDAESSISKLKHYFTVQLDSIPFGSFNNGKHEPIYVVRDDQQNIQFKFIVGKQSHKIDYLELCCPSYTSKNGLKVGCTVQMVKEIYKKLKTTYFYDYGLHIYPNKTNYALKINDDSWLKLGYEPFTYENATMDSIPNELVIDRIAILDKSTRSKKRKSNKKSQE